MKFLFVNELLTTCIMKNNNKLCINVSVAILRPIKNSVSLKYHKLKMQIVINQTNLPPAMISSEIPLLKVKMLRWVCNLLANFIKMENERGGEKEEVWLYCGRDSSEHIWTLAFWSQEPGSLRKGPPWAWGRAKGRMSLQWNLCLHLFFRLWIFLGFFKFYRSTPWENTFPWSLKSWLVI